MTSHNPGKDYAMEKNALRSAHNVPTFIVYIGFAMLLLVGHIVYCKLFIVYFYCL